MRVARLIVSSSCPLTADPLPLGWFALRAPRNDDPISSTPSITRILHHIPVIALLADVLLLVVAMALGGVEGDFGRAAGALVTLIFLGNGLDGFSYGFCHGWSPLGEEEKR